MSRLLSDEELTLLARSPRQQLADAVGRGAWDEAERLWQEIRPAYFDLIRLFRGWVASLQEFILTNYGRDALADAARLESVVSGMLARRITVEELVRGAEDGDDPVAASLARRDAGAVLAAFDAVEPAIRHAHDAVRDWISALLSWVYRNRGIEALRAALRQSSELYWMPWMMEDVTHEPVQRLRDWTRLLKANFATIRLEEDDEKFVILQDPCGSCARQHAEGRYEGPAALAMVKEKDPLTFMEGNVTVYRTHIAMMHFIMPLERVGGPWPALWCPSTKEGVCRGLLYKDPRYASPEDYRRVGLEPPRTT